MASTGTGVVIGSHSLKVVQIRRKGGVPRLARVVNLKMDAAMAERAFDAQKKDRIRALLESAGVKPDECMLGLTGRDLIVRYTHVPPVPDWRLDMLMKFEIEEVSEQSGGEVSADWAQLDVDESASGENTILVALAKNASLLPRLELLKELRQKVRGACPNSIAMFQAFTSTAKVPGGEVTLLMHVGAENSDIAIQQDGKLLFARNVSGGGRLFTEAIMQQFNVPYDRAEKMKFQKADVTPRSAARYEDSMAEKVSNAVLGVTGQFVSMVHSSVMFCKAQTKMKELSVDRVVLGGGGANLKGFAEYPAQNLGIPVEVLDPLRAVDASGLSPEEAQVVEQDGTGLTVALGLALLAMERGPFTLEILPEEYRRRRNFIEKDAWMIGAAAVTAVLIGVLFYTSGRDHAAVKREKDTLTSREGRYTRQNQQFQNAERDYRQLEKKWVALRDIARVGPSLSRAVALVDQVLLGGFETLSISRMWTETQSVDPPEKPGEPRRVLAPGEDPPKILVVKVGFRADIQDVTQANKVYADFTRDLSQAIQTMPGATVDSGALQNRKSFEFSVSFAPAPEPEGE